ncbi:MAG: hypothetical protein Fur0034_06550 [Desulfuromonadia bacterium]
MSYIIIDSNETATRDDYSRLTASLAGVPREQAIAALRSFLSRNPGCGEAHNDLGMLLQKSGNPTLALAHFEKACRIDPANAEFRRNLASFYASELGWIEDAIDMYIDILSSNRRDIDAMISLGRLGATLSGARALEGPPGWEERQTPPGQPELTPDELHRQGIEKITEGDTGGAVELIRKAVSLSPANPLYHNDLGYALHQSGDISGALAAYEKAVSLDPENPLYAKNLADLSFAGGIDPDRAITIYLDLHRRFPHDVEVLVNLGHISSRLERPDEARSFYRRALEIEPWNREAREALAVLSPAAPRKTLPQMLEEARSLHQGGKSEEALKLLETAVAQHPDSAVAWNDLGVVAAACGDMERGYAAHRKGVELDPQNPTFLKNLADISLVRSGNADEAIRIYLELFKWSPRDLDVLTSLGHISQLIGRPDEARRFYRRALEIEPWNRDVRGALEMLR